VPRSSMRFVLGSLTFLALPFTDLARGGEAGAPPAPHERGRRRIEKLLAGELRWTVSPPLLGPAERPSDPCDSIKDPSIVFSGGRWHLFATIRSRKRTHQIEYLSFRDFEDAAKAERHILKIHAGYFCAPEVFFFEPHQKWYMIYQGPSPVEKDQIAPTFSTTADIADPDSWARPEALIAARPRDAEPKVERWIDFWVICDETRAHLFFTSNDGMMWRAETRLADFPRGWDRPRVVLTGDIFEASHTYRLKGLGKYLTVVEAQGALGRRYYKAYLADRLDGRWSPLAATAEKPFASPANCREGAGAARWTDSVSHGELLRSGRDQFLEVDPANLRFLFQGVSDRERESKSYGQIPWRLGLLEPVE
jgi:glycosyl hydrolase family 62